MSSVVRCKFRVVSKSDNAGHAPGDKTPSSTTVRLGPSSGPGNETWSKYTPSGAIELTITNPAAVQSLELGQYYFVDFTPTE